MKIALTGATGFIGKNFYFQIADYFQQVEIVSVKRNLSLEKLKDLLEGVDALVHLAGVNRPINSTEFDTVNVGYTKLLCEAIDHTRSPINVVFTSSTQAKLDNEYGRSKLAAETLIQKLAQRKDTSVSILRLPGVFGKWCKPNYNSVVATFCSNVIKGVPLEIDDPTKVIELAYIDDVINEIANCIQEPDTKNPFSKVSPSYHISVTQIAEKVTKFHRMRQSCEVGGVGNGFDRALYATYLSHLKPESFSYKIQDHKDDRGRFAEFLRTTASGQISFFTAEPGVSRGGHYHHTKAEKFLVISGQATFDFHNIISNENICLHVSDTELEVIESVPGWAHRINNVGNCRLVVLLWSSENFDRKRPDTIAVGSDLWTN